MQRKQRIQRSKNANFEIIAEECNNCNKFEEIRKVQENSKLANKAKNS